MVVNPFFLHGSTQEQNLMQDLVNEQLRMYGIDVFYIPREFVRDATIMREVTSSQFRSYFIIEAYLNNFDGYGGQGDIMSKFGIQVKDDVTLTISRERYESYVAPFLNSRMLYLMNTSTNDNELPCIHRPKEGDLIYFPLGRRLFEIKFVEHEKPFYQLGKGYTYDLECELFEYEDEVFNTSIDEIDSTLQDKGYITSLELIALSNRAEVSYKLGTGYIDKILILNEGKGYNGAPDIVIDPPEIGSDPQVVAIMNQATVNNNTSSIKDLVVFRSGSGYTEAPEVNVATADRQGSGAVIRAGINTDPLSKGIVEFDVEEPGTGYADDAKISVYDNANNVIAEGIALTNGTRIVKAVVTDPGKDLFEGAVVVVDAPPDSGDGDFIYNELIEGKSSGTQARVRGWDGVNKILQITNLDPEKKDVDFAPEEVIVGKTSRARYSLKRWDTKTPKDKYSGSDEIQEEANEIVDETEFNQFGSFNDYSNNFDSSNPFGD